MRTLAADQRPNIEAARPNSSAKEIPDTAEGSINTYPLTGLQDKVCDVHYIKTAHVTI